MENTLGNDGNGGAISGKTSASERVSATQGQSQAILQLGDGSSNVDNNGAVEAYAALVETMHYREHVELDDPYSQFPRGYLIPQNRIAQEGQTFSDNGTREGYSAMERDGCIFPTPPTLCPRKIPKYPDGIHLGHYRGRTPQDHAPYAHRK